MLPHQRFFAERVRGGVGGVHRGWFGRRRGLRGGCQSDCCGRQQERSTPGSQWSRELDGPGGSRATKEHLATLDDAPSGAPSEVTSKFILPSDPAAQWTGATRGPAFFVYSD